MKTFSAVIGPDLNVDTRIDSDGDLNIEVGSGDAYLARAEVVRLRDHLNEVLGEVPSPSSAGALTVTVSPVLDTSALIAQVEALALTLKESAR